MNELYKDDIIIEKCNNKNILHIGATDTPYHLEKAKKNLLLHQKLLKICKNLVGIDVDKKSILELKKYGINNILHGNILDENYIKNFIGQKFDFIVIGDVIEHLENPGIMLDNIKKIGNNDTKIILTTPNVFSYYCFKAFVFGLENVHPDHVFWPSYKTMRELFRRKGFTINYFSYCFWGSSSEKKLHIKLIQKLLLSRIKHILPCMIFVLKK